MILNPVSCFGKCINQNIKTFYLTQFKKNGKLLSNNNTFVPIASLFYLDNNTEYLPLENSNRIVKRIGTKSNWSKFEKILSLLG